MSARPDDLPGVSHDEDYRRLRVDELIRLFALHRENRDEDRMRAVWGVLVMKTYDRVKAAVASFRFPGGQTMPPHQRDDALQDAYLRVMAMAGTFKGTSEGEYKAALHTCVRFACLDLGRTELEHEKHTRARLHESAFDEDDSDRGRYDDAQEAEAQRRQDELLGKLQAEAELHRERDLVAWAISQVENDKLRPVLEMTYLEGLDGDAIAARLGISHANVYTRRRRGNIELEAILRDHRA